MHKFNNDLPALFYACEAWPGRAAATICGVYRWGFGMLLLFALLGVIGPSTALHAQERRDIMREPEWDSVFEVQRLLSDDYNEGALEHIKRLRQSNGELRPAENIWLLIYKGIALDRLGEREQAKEAFREAANIYPHPVARRGLIGPVNTLNHLEELRRDMPPRARFKQETVIVPGGNAVTVTLLLPGEKPKNKTGYPVVVKVGHPKRKNRTRYELLKIQKLLPASEPVILLTTDVIRVRENLPVDSPELMQGVPGKFRATLLQMMKRYPIDPDRVYLTGFSYDGVWAWMLGFAEPDLYAAVAALSAVSFPAAISGRLENSTNLPMCILRGRNDTLFPSRMYKEVVVGEQVSRNNSQSYVQFLSGVSHKGVWKHAGICLKWLLEKRRQKWPLRVMKTLFSPEERSAYWLTALEFMEQREVDWRKPYARIDAKMDWNILSIRTENIRRLKVTIEPTKMNIEEPIAIVANGVALRKDFRVPTAGVVVEINLESNTLNVVGSGN